VAILFNDRNPGVYSEVRVNVIVVSPSGVFPLESQKDFAIATHLKRGDLAAHSRFVVDAAITSAFEHYGVYCKAMEYKENVMGARSQYTQIEKEFREEAEELTVTDSIQDTEAIELDEASPLVVRAETELTGYEVYKASEIEQEVREKTGNPAMPIQPHPDGHKKDGKDGRDDAFGRSYTKVRKTKPGPAPVSYIKTIPLRVIDDPNVEQVEVYFASCGNYIPQTVSSNITQQEIETMACNLFNGNFGLIDFRPPAPGIHYCFKAMFCRERENAAWLDCQRGDTAEEEWVLFGQELSDNDIIRIMEQRWFAPLKRFKDPLPRPLANNSIVMFERRLTDEEVDPEDVSGIPAADPMQIFRDRAWYKPPRPSTPVCFNSIETEIDDLRSFEDGVPKIRHVIAAGPHNVSLILRQNASPDRILEVLFRRTGIQGEWNVKIVDEGDVKKGTPRRALLTPLKAPIVPQNITPTVEEGEFRIFFGTIERKITAPINISPEEAMRRAAADAKLDDKLALDRSFPATLKTPPIVITKRIQPVEPRQAFPDTISIAQADHIEGGRPVNYHKIKCKGGESPDEQARLVSQAFNSPMWISEWVEEKDGLVHVQCRRLEFTTIKFSFKDKIIES
jgi:hypothetical protein